MQVNTNVQQAGVNEYFLILEDALAINHVVVFLTGQVPFSEGFGASIYLGWPAEGGGVSWQLLGFLSNNKPSAIYKITKVTDLPVLTHSLSLPLSQVKPSEVVTPFGQDALASFAGQVQSAALVGVRVEPLEQMLQKTPASGTQATTLSTMTEFSQKMVENLYNFASSYAVDPTQTALSAGETYVPASALTQWYTNFQRKLTANPNFWKAL